MGGLVMTRTEARKICRAMIKADWNNPLICEDFQTGTIIVKAYTQAWMARTIHTMEDWQKEEEFQ